jgi:hypothetical protein
MDAPCFATRGKKAVKEVPFKSLFMAIISKTDVDQGNLTQDPPMSLASSIGQPQHLATTKMGG